MYGGTTLSKLQSAWSDVCGQYCIFYLAHRARGTSMNKIAQLFKNDTMLDDTKVVQFIKSHFKILLKQPNVVGLDQFSRMLFNK